MGIDLLDLVFRIEKRFGVRLHRSDFAVFTGQKDVTVGELHELVCVKLREAGRAVPVSSWNGVRLEVGVCLSVSPLKIRRSNRLVADLGMS